MMSANQGWIEEELDQEWVDLLSMARQLGITPDEVKLFIAGAAPVQTP
ncbi:anti-repressor SinI family protein [Paenibacillus gansuensis]|uniref:Anti-repressor SinI family protein n=1 Tax=Paenibacillus gansuensis TaxID=306542 RepID=A0ABW5PF87_9BACL